MAYTATDLANVQEALIKLATGKRVVSYTIAGRTVTYNQAQIKEVQALRDEIRAEVENTSAQRCFVLAQTTDKGL